MTSPKDHLLKIREFYSKFRRMPSFSEIMNVTELKSKGSVTKLVARLSEAGILKKDAEGRLVPFGTFLELPLVGYVEAGFPSPAEEELRDTISLDEFLIKRREATFMFRVKGDSMIDAGIMPGDLVLVERGIEAKSGDIVIAEIDNEWTMKYFRKRGMQMSFEPANKKYKPIVPGEEQNVRIAAVVKAVIRKY